MRFLILSLFFIGCNSTIDPKVLENENIELRKQVDSLKNELNKCNMMIESYEGLPMGI